MPKSFWMMPTGLESFPAVSMPWQPWSPGAGALELEPWSWSPGAGAPELELEPGSPGAGARERSRALFHARKLQDDAYRPGKSQGYKYAPRALAALELEPWSL